VLRRKFCNERKMSLVPIKLLKNGVSKNTLLNLKKESYEIDTTDYIESRILTNTRAKELLAIEDASEMAKLYLHKSGLFEKIVRDIKGETGKEFTFQCKKTKAMKLKKKSDIEYIMMEVSYDNTTGHYGMAKVNHRNKTARLYDSMVKSESDFKSPLGKYYQTHTIFLYLRMRLNPLVVSWLYHSRNSRIQAILVVSLRS